MIAALPVYLLYYLLFTEGAKSNEEIKHILILKSSRFSQKKGKKIFFIHEIHVYSVISLQSFIGNIQQTRSTVSAVLQYLTLVCTIALGSLGSNGLIDLFG